MSTEATGGDEIRRFEEQYRRNPDSLVFARLADGYRKAGEPDRALEILDEGIRRHRDYPSAYIIRARTFIDLERAEDADAAFRHVLELDAQNLVAMRGLADLSEERGDRGAAAEWYERIVAQDPLNAEASEALVRLRGEREGDGVRGPAPGGLPPLEPTSEEWWSSSTPVAPFEEAIANAPSPAHSGRDPLPDDVAGELEMIGAELASDVEESRGSADLGFDEIVLPTSETTQTSAAGDAFADLEGEGQAEPVEADVEDIGAEGPEPMSEPSSAEDSGSAWWFEDPGETDSAEDGDLLTRTMADLYARQGLVEEAAAIYRELLVDRPGDPDLERALADLLEGVDQEDVEGEPEPPREVAGPAVPEADAGRGAGADEGVPEAAPYETGREVTGVDVTEAARSAHGPVDPYASHDVPAVAGRSDYLLEWLRRLE